MNKFIQQIKDRREKYDTTAQEIKEKFKNNPEIFHELANELNRRDFKSNFQRVRDNVVTDDFYMAQLYLAEIAADLAVLHELVGLMDKELKRKPEVKITDEMEDALYNSWGIRDLKTGDDVDAVFAAKELYPDIHGLVVIGIFSNFCDDNRC